MARDDVFRRSFEAGTAFLSMTRERAEVLVKELVKAGEVQRSKAQKVIDELVERSRKGTEELREFVRGEIAEQVASLGLATKDDIARIEARLDAMGAAPPATEPPAPARPRKAPPVKRSGSTRATTATKAAKATRAAKGPRTTTAAKAPPAAKAATKAPSAGKAGAAKKAAAPPAGGQTGPSPPTGGPPPIDASGG